MNSSIEKERKDIITLGTKESFTVYPILTAQDETLSEFEVCCMYIGIGPHDVSGEGAGHAGDMVT